MADNTSISKPVFFQSDSHLLNMRLSKEYVTEARIKDLFQVPTLVLFDKEGEEILLSSIVPGQKYFVVQSDFYPHGFGFEVSDKIELARKSIIKELYKPLHPHLWNIDDSLFESSFLDAIHKYQASKDLKDITSILKKETKTEIYSFRIFTDKFCKELLEEVDHFEGSGLPAVRPNSMNNYGVILDELGMTTFFSQLREKYILPLASALYPKHGGEELDHHHAFIVQYKLTEDKDLGFHYDESEVTLNVCLGRKFKGSQLFFMGWLEFPETHREQFIYEHHPGVGILHIGRHRHGALPIEDGERYNLIVWFRSSAYRQRRLEQGKDQACNCDDENCNDD